MSQLILDEELDLPQVLSALQKWITVQRFCGPVNEFSTSEFPQYF